MLRKRLAITFVVAFVLHVSGIGAFEGDAMSTRIIAEIVLGLTASIAWTIKGIRDPYWGRHLDER
ncbi:MAG: hypothetical protein M3R02_21590 [Chloroflexota bacterium]|nr:hypothetical protein [Chloroflexota bacterium]